MIEVDTIQSKDHSNDTHDNFDDNSDSHTTAVHMSADIQHTLSDSIRADYNLSIADLERKHSRPMRWIIYIIFLLIATIAPYWSGRVLAVHATSWVIASLSVFSPQGVALISWMVTMAACIGLALAVVDSHQWLWRIVFVIGFAAEQFIAGLCLLNFNFWYATYVVYGKSAYLVNAADLGIIGAGLGVVVFAVIFVGLLVTVNKDSPLNILIQSWASFILFYVIESVILLVILFGGLLNIFSGHLLAM